MHSKLLTAHGLLEKPQTSFCPPGIFYGKNSDRYFIASDAIGFGTDPIHFGAPACRFVSIPHRFGLDRIGMQPATRGFGSFRYHFKSERYRNDRKQLPLKSINGSDTRFFDIVLTQSDITLSQLDIVLSHREISWSRQRLAPGLRRFTSFWRSLSSGRSDTALWPTDVWPSRTRLSLRRSDQEPAPGKPSMRCRRVTLNNNISSRITFERTVTTMCRSCCLAG